MFTESQHAFWKTRGWLLDSQTTLDAGATDLSAWADEIARLPADGSNGAATQHREGTPQGDLHARTEHFAHLHPAIRALTMGGALEQAAAALLGEPALLYKEKLNHKLPGGAGFAPHQDATAYKFVDRHITAMVAVDDAEPDNGGMELVSGLHRELLETDGDGCLAASVADGLRFDPVVVKSGEVLWFHSLTPHRSASNTSGRPRRAFFFTFNAAAHGDLRDAYYRDRAEQLRAYAEQGDSAVSRVSTIGHFQGAAPHHSNNTDGSTMRRQS